MLSFIYDIVNAPLLGIVWQLLCVDFIFSFSRLIQRWVENIIEAVRAASKETLRPEKIRPHMDNLTSQLLALSKCWS